MSYNSLEEIVRECQEKDLPFDEVILLDDMNERNVSREESIETMRGMWEAMKGAERNYDGSLQSRSGLVGGAGKTMRAYVESGNTLCGPFVGKVMASALAMGESNACMKRIDLRLNSEIFVSSQIGFARFQASQISSSARKTLCVLVSSSSMQTVRS